jgi:hypothetical protein
MIAKRRKTEKKESSKVDKISQAAKIINVSEAELKRAIKEELIEATAEKIVEMHYQTLIDEATKTLSPRVRAVIKRNAKRK